MCKKNNRFNRNFKALYLQIKGWQEEENHQGNLVVALLYFILNLERFWTTRNYQLNLHVSFDLTFEAAFTPQR